MNENTLYNFIDSFNKKSGEYTPEELYEIGCKHKSLPKNEKNWSNLTNYVGYPGSAEGYRGFVNYHLKTKSPIFKTPSPENTKSVDNGNYEDEYKAKTQLRDIYNSYRLYLRDEARIETLQDCIVNAARMQPTLPKITYTKKDSNNKVEAILMLSDWHIGQLVNNFYNTYNKEVALLRLNNIVSNVITYCQLFKVHKLNILNLGDLIEGIINVNGRINQQEDVGSQLICAAEYMCQVLNVLQKAAPVVTYRSCTDNHSRLIADKHQNIAKENLNRIVDWFVEERFSKDEKKNLQIIKDNLDIGFGKFKLEDGKNVVFFHGHEDSKSQTLQSVVGATQEWIDIVCCGHWHNPSEHTYQNMRLYINNSLCGTGDYALSKRLFTKPSQKLLIVEGNNFIDIDISADINC